MTSYVFIRCSVEYFFIFSLVRISSLCSRRILDLNLCSKTVYRIQTKGFYRRQAVLPRGVNKYITTIIITHIVILVILIVRKPSFTV